jgi:hypothetical protein
MITWTIRPFSVAHLSLLACCSLAALTLPAQAKNYYVSGTGNDSQSGLSPSAAFRTLQHAADLTKPGDVVNAMNGTYTNANPTGSVLNITTSGTPDAWITYQAMPGQKPMISFNGWEGVSFDAKVAYIEVKGFTITGNNYNVTLEGALRQGKIGDPIYSGNCIAADGRKGTATLRPHHLRILNNVTRACGGAGIATIQADYVTISGNTVYDSAWYAIYGCSGISLLENWNSDDSTATKMIITRNRVYGNKELVPWVDAGKITDGEGIIIDTARSPTLGNYKGSTLIANNVLYDNGSAAIEVFRSDHVDIINNSTYNDVSNPPETGNGELNLNDVTGINVVNNVFSSAHGQNPISVNVNKPCQCSFRSNIYYNGANKPADLKGTNDLTADPLYINPNAKDLASVDLSLSPSSPAASSGEKLMGRALDFTGKPRPDGGKIDRGACQH